MKKVIVDKLVKFVTIQPMDRLDYIGQVRDLVSRTSSYTDPFLYYFPDILLKPEFEHLNYQSILRFTRLALLPEKSPLIADALKILNKLVNPQDGQLLPPSRDMFYENQNFFWHELGVHTTAVDVIMHVLNKIMFVSTL